MIGQSKAGDIWRKFVAIANREQFGQCESWQV